MARLNHLAPVTALSLELVHFDTQLMQNAEISGVTYQQGELAGYEVREYLLQKWGRRCAYCGCSGVPLQVEHLIPRHEGVATGFQTSHSLANPATRPKATGLLWNSATSLFKPKQKLP